MIKDVRIISFLVFDGILMLLAVNEITNKQAACMSAIKGLEVDESVIANTLRYGYPLNLKQAEAFFEDNINVEQFQPGSETFYEGD